ncbi:6-phosphogluconolactonase [Buchnera aphidicola (Nipponaphis monzeni)]|uniref:6-phosphogluconolactonase n=1 Tax=Buchnera aphidicola (Nipponaphis monzeni) TaxID=2495405 RepID=A0A455TA74_9GAMM|nr:beta-propeller fold lactonase family protein [Buchnera aphidicola]BBI01241.1 6-phosphogluconolactonase [Buchnera aphidicola (Nipponaphis monzeni)]
MKKIIYVSNYLDEEIQVLQIDNNLSLQTIQKIKIKSQAQPLIISENKKLLYAGVRPIPKIIVYKILDDGILQKIYEIATIGAPNHLAFNNDKTLLFCSSYHGECISIFLINKHGLPYKLINTITNIKGCHYSIYINTNTIITTALKSDQILIFNSLKNENFLEKKITAINVTKKSGPRHLVLHPFKSILYSINELNSTIDVWFLSNAMNMLHFVQRIKILPESYKGNCWGADIHITPCGNYLYASDRITNIITAFIINQYNGKIQILEYYVTEKQPRSFNIDNLGKYLAVTGEKSNNLTLYEIKLNTGHLNKIGSYPVGNNPIWTLIHSI